MTSMVRGEPDYINQVSRRRAFEADHPDVQITYHGPHWEARIPHDAGETVINRYELRVLLDKLEKLTADYGKPSNGGHDLPIRAALSPRRRAPGGRARRPA